MNVHPDQHVRSPMHQLSVTWDTAQRTAGAEPTGSGPTQSKGPRLCPEREGNS